MGIKQKQRQWKYFDMLSSIMNFDSSTTHHTGE